MNYETSGGPLELEDTTQQIPKPLVIILRQFTPLLSLQPVVLRPILTLSSYPFLGLLRLPCVMIVASILITWLCLPLLHFIILYFVYRFSMELYASAKGSIRYVKLYKELYTHRTNSIAIILYLTNQPTKRPTDQPINQPTSQPTNHPTNQPTDRPSPTKAAVAKLVQ
jgi:hypothetical protein